ncbi:MurR/RpiR family transcriptional regulator [Pseudovibrio sp. SPO723]|uniref:MurR/RpiR family transcriptional regulator n=1 Tax=Nesiotobacter zosterae TaxID=392721 RepID=UPI0029C1A380|nr:MurR/RpiR family transcriptional regulator [Pseudovibrio sp. SPO723]MDX5594570.1 MurR/RpiR family transcriptional regulator [Pseudovibrio sp. SPO723]
MSIIRTLTPTSGSLTATEQKIVAAVEAEPMKAAMLSVAALAKEVGVHRSSLVRLAHKLGFDGYPELRAQIHSEVFRANEPEERLRERLGNLPVGQVLSDLVKRETNALAELQTMISEADLEAAAQILNGAQRTLACGEGSSGFLADVLTDRLGRVGMVAESIPLNPREIAKHLASANSGDAFVAVAVTRMPEVLVRAMAVARNAGFQVLLITDTSVPFDETIPNVTLTVPRSAAIEAQTLVVPTALISALVLAATKSLGNEALEAVKRYGELRHLIKGS